MTEPFASPGPETSPPVGADWERAWSTGEVRAWQKRLLQMVLRGAVVLGGIGGVIGLLQLPAAWMPVYLALYAGFCVVALWPRTPYQLQAAVMLGLIYGVSVLALYKSGLSGDGRLLLLILPLVARVFGSRRLSLAALVLGLLTLLFFAWAFTTGWLSSPEGSGTYSTNPRNWLSALLVYLVISGLIFVTQDYLLPRFVHALISSRQLVQELTQAHEALSERATGLEESRRLLEKRTRALESTARVARDAVAILDLQELLSKVVLLVEQRFGFARVDLYLLDSTATWAELRASAGDAGQDLRVAGSRLRVGQAGIVGDAASRGIPRIARPTAAAPRPLPKVLSERERTAALPPSPGQDGPAESEGQAGAQGTAQRSGLALPLWARSRIIGVLHVESQQPDAFADEDVMVLQTLADQVALAISNATLFEQAESNLAAAALPGQALSPRAWLELLRTEDDLVRRHDPQGALATATRSRPAAVPEESGAKNQDLLLGQAVVDGQDPTLLSTAIRSRGQTLGLVHALKRRDAGPWSEEEVDLLQTLTEQLGVALESARLYRETQIRAARDRLLTEVTGRMRESLDPEMVLRTSVEEIYRALGSDEVVIRLVGDEFEPSTLLVSGEPGSPEKGNGHAHQA